jgi:hypothetical protein
VPNYIIIIKMITQTLTSFFIQPKVLSECLFRAFASDLTGNVEINDFIAALAVLDGKDRTHTLQFVFRVYDLNGSGVIERAKVEKLLLIAYGDRLKSINNSKKVLQQLDSIFSQSRDANTRSRSPNPRSPNPRSPPLSPVRNNKGISSPVLLLRDFEQYTGPLDVLGEWVLSVLSAFTEPLPPHLLTLNRRYTAPTRPDDIMNKYSLQKATCLQLHDTYLNRCSMVGSRAELTLDSWLRWTNGFMHPPLAQLVFEAKVGNLSFFLFLCDLIRQ